MDPLAAVALLVAVAAPIAVVSGWFVQGGFGGLGSFVGRGDRDAWWRSSMPWPQGVQEEDGPRWRLGGDEASDSHGSADGDAGGDDALDVRPVRAHPRLVVRAGGRGGAGQVR
jgi:hypothetical protein